MAHPLPFPVLIGDVGGTNARFALLADPHAPPSGITIFATAEHEGPGEAIAARVLAGSPLKPRSALIALAGPLGAQQMRLTNARWTVRPEELAGQFGLSDLVLINDFTAQALAVAVAEPERMEQIGGGTADPEGPRVVLGPGTGLGVAGLLRVDGRWVPVAGEGGHVDLGARTARERRIWPHLEPEGDRVSAETVLSGAGLLNLYRAVVSADGRAPVLALPAQVSAAALEGTDPAAQEALAIFAACLGRIAGDLALVFMSRGGVFLTGGIVPRILPALRRGGFRAAFEDKAPHGTLLSSMKVHVVTDPLAPLLGLAAFARRPAQFVLGGASLRWSAA